MAKQERSNFERALGNLYRPPKKEEKKISNPLAPRDASADEVAALLGSRNASAEEVAAVLFYPEGIRDDGSDSSGSGWRQTFPPLGDLITDANQAEFEQKKALDEDDEPDAEIIPQVFEYQDDYDPQEKADGFELKEKKKLLQSLVAYTGWSETEAKRFAFPDKNSRKLDWERVENFVKCLQYLRIVNTNFALTVPLICVDKQGDIYINQGMCHFPEGNFHLDRDASYLVELIESCHEIDKNAAHKKKKEDKPTPRRGRFKKQ